MSRYQLSAAELAELLEGEPHYRVAQLRDGLYRRLAEPADITELPKSLRERLSMNEALAPSLRQHAEQRAHRGATTKWLFDLADGRSIETVLMLYPRHATVCVSSQAGCAMGCRFCATGQAGYERHLSAGEILEQVVHAARAARAVGRRLDHVVFMGMGEPFANFGAVWDATCRLVSDLGFAARHITLSTVGLVPQIRRLTTETLQVNLALSLHAARDELRSELVPLNRRYPIAELQAACKSYTETTRRRISLEWALIDNINDTERDLEELAGFARPLHAHVNLIALNETPFGTERGLHAPSRARVIQFRDGLLAKNVNATIRQTRGQEIAAACGQLFGAARLGARPERVPVPGRASELAN